jgi:hypothetical protein
MAIEMTGIPIGHTLLVDAYTVSGLNQEKRIEAV